MIAQQINELTEKSLLMRLERAAFGRSYDEFEGLLKEYMAEKGRTRQFGVKLESLALYDESLKIDGERFVALMSSVLTDINYEVSLNLFNHIASDLFTFRCLCRGSAQSNMDVVLYILLGRTDGEEVAVSDFYKIFFTLSMESQINFDFFALFDVIPEIVMTEALSRLTQFSSFSAPANKRKLEAFNFIEKVKDFTCYQNIDEKSLLTAAYMYCSYPMYRDKHKIKEYINEYFRKYFYKKGVFEDNVFKKRNAKKKKPVIGVVLEVLNINHAMYRVYAQFLTKLKESYELVGFSAEETVDQGARLLFDRFVSWADLKDQSHLDCLKNAIEAETPDMLLYPSVGMDSRTILLSSMRIAPIQLMFGGHPATSYSPSMDYFIVEEGMVGDPDLFSEAQVAVPRNSFVQALPVTAERVTPKIFKNRGVIKIAVPAAAFKLTHEFIEVCKEINKRATIKVEFHFFPNIASIYYWDVKNTMRKLLSNSYVYPCTSYNQYIEKINDCDLHLSSFPFGGTNSLVDSFRQGLPIVALDGGECHSKVDGDFIVRTGSPEWLSAGTIEEYIVAALRLINNEKERVAISNKLLEVDMDKIFFEDNGSMAGAVKTFDWIYKNHELIQNEGKKIWHLDDQALFD